MNPRGAWISLPVTCALAGACGGAVDPPADAATSTPASASSAPLRKTPLERASARLVGSAPFGGRYKGKAHLSRVLDVNGDRFGDLILACYRPEGGGRAFAYLGSPTGLGREPAFEIVQPSDGPHAKESFTTLTDLGDVDGDGRSDVVISGSVFGTLAGLTGPPIGTVEIQRHYDARRLGDVDGDGWPDLLTDPNVDSPLAWKRGTASGFVEGDRLQPPNQERHFGIGDMLGFSDVDGDGIADVIVGANLPASAPDEGPGLVAIFRGSPRGLEPTPWRVVGARGRYEWSSHYFGQTVRGVGDVNGDGYGDFFASSSGSAVLFLGASTPDAIVESGMYAFEPDYASAGDFNGDGIADVAAGLAGGDPPLGVDVYMGSTMGLATEPALSLDPSTPATGPCGFGTLAGVP